MRRSAVVPGDILLHPVALGAIAVLLVNDHVGKGAAPGVFTGKASDLAGLVVFPLLVVAVLEVLRRRASLRFAVMVGVIVITGTAFTAVKLVPAVADAYSHALGIAMVPARTVASGTQGVPPDAARPVRVIADPSDLVALPALLIALVVCRRRTTASAGSLPVGALP